MPISKGGAYGEPGPLPADAVVVGDDASASRLLERARQERRPFPVIGLVGGDLCRTLGGGAGGPTATEARLRAQGGVRFRVDVVEALLDGSARLFVAHLVAHNPMWTHVTVAMNAQWYRRWQLGPRAHPGDGLLDVYRADLALSQVMAVRSRARHGAHLPHPGITERRVPAEHIEADRALAIRIDGARTGSVRHLGLRVEPDALVVVVA